MHDVIGKCPRAGVFVGFLTNMTATLKSIEGSGDIAAAMGEIGRRARAAAQVLALAPAEQKNRALQLMAAAVRAQVSSILAANADDVSEARAAGVAGAFLDRLALDQSRVEAIADGIDVVRALKDPVGIVMESWARPNGMRIERVRVPLGVIGIIYESRPNVTRRRWRALPEGRQRRGPARRLGQHALQPRDPCCAV
jgi:Gamma-glutamyl phosphate reductase